MRGTIHFKKPPCAQCALVPVPVAGRCFVVIFCDEIEGEEQMSSRGPGDNIYSLGSVIMIARYGDMSTYRFAPPVPPSV